MNFSCGLETGVIKCGGDIFQRKTGMRMNEKEIAEIRRRFRPEKSNITHIRGCYVNEKREIVSEFDQPLATLPQEETECMLAVLKRALSGTPGRNLVDISFATRQVVDSDEHRLLMALRDSSLRDENAVRALFRRIIEVLAMEGTYLILLAHDAYDIPFRGKDGAALEDASGEVYSYILCAVCPVKPTKPALSYDVPENSFRSRLPDWLVGSPEAGFLFPAFNDRSADIYSALYYSKDPAENYPELIDAVFRVEAPMPAAAQKETFHTLLAETLSEECSYDVMQAVDSRLREMIEEHKANKAEEPLTLSGGAVKAVLESCGVSGEHVEAFGEKYEEEFGPDMELSPRTLVDNRQFEVRTPDVKIQVNPERTDLLETRIIDGSRYILIRAGEGVEVNGVPIRIVEE